MSHRSAPIFVASVALAAASAVGLASPGTAATARHHATPQAISWSPVSTVWDHGPAALTSVTTDSGMVVAAWSDLGYHHAYAAVRPAGGTWSPPTAISGYAPVIRLAADGKGAWMVWQGGRTVTAMHIGDDGSLASPEAIGASSDPFLVALNLGVGAHGAVAVSWRTHAHSPTMIAYRPAGGAWQQPEDVPGPADVVGLVVGAAGTTQVVQAEGSSLHQQLTYTRRSPGGTWGSPFVVSADASVPTVAGNPQGDLVVGWQVVNGNGTRTLVARYKASDGAFGDAHHLNESVPDGSYVAFGMAADGSLASAYRISTQGSQQIQMTPADSTGLWLDPQTLDLTGYSYGVAMNAGGAFVVTSPSGGGMQLVRCDASDVCGGSEVNHAPGSRVPTTTLGPRGAINLVWAHGCHGEACNPVSVLAQRGR